MMLARLTSHLVKATRLTGCFVPLCGNVCYKRTSAFYSTRQHQKPQISPHTWYNFQPELDEVLVPRMMSISPLESLLTSRYYLPKPDSPNDHEELQKNLEYYDCPTQQSTENVGEDRANAGGEVQCKNVLKIRRRKMNKHKYRKLMKRTKFVRQKVKNNRNNRKQANFEKDLERIWKKAGLKKAPVGWQTPKIYIKH